MAQFFEDFESAVIGTQPTGWSTIWTTVSPWTVKTFEAEKALNWPSGKTGFDGLIFDAATNVPGPSEIVTQMQISGPAGSYGNQGIIVSASPTAGYFIPLRGGFERLEIVRYTSSNPETVVSSASFSDTRNRYVNLKARVEANGTIKVKSWEIGAAEPAAWLLEYAPPTQILGSLGLFARDGRFGTEAYWRYVGIGTDGDPAPTSAVSAPTNFDRTTSEAASGADTWAAICAASTSTVSAASASNSISVIASINTSITSAANASDSLSVIASISASIISAAQASDQTGDSPAASVSLDSAATGSDSVDALASAAASLSAGAAAGESWTVQAQVVASLLESAASSDSIARATQNALNAAIAEGSVASVQFTTSISLLAGTLDTASVNDAFIAVVVTLAGFSSGAVAVDSFGINFGQIKNIQSGAISVDSWALLASLTASLSEVCSAQDVISARADVMAGITYGAIATDTFSIVNQAIQYLVMGAITLRSALNYSISTKPALTQTVTIKPGN